jgi:hypothetical protein
MSELLIKQLVDLVRKNSLLELHIRDIPEPMVYICEAPPPVAWNGQSVESALNVRLPQELIDLWKEAAGLKLFVDRNSGQWGMIIWSPEDVVPSNRKCKKWVRAEDLRQGDLIIGNFRGDTDMVLLRCDKSASDYGSVIIIDPLESREDWRIAATSLSLFLQKFFETKGEKYWEYGWEERNA